MSTADKQIADMLAKYDEPMVGNTWKVQGNAVILHKALERIAAKAGVEFDEPTIVRAERDEAVILVRGRLGERRVWSIGEALINTNYRVSGKQAAYVYAMAEKRAVDRVILKLLGLHGVVYSEEEADELRDELKRQKAQERLSRQQGRQASPQPQQPATPPQPQSVPLPHGHGDDFPGNADLDRETITRDIRAKIDKAETYNKVADFMLSQDVQRDLTNNLPPAVRDDLRAYAKARMIALGWPAKKAG